ncbi:hypothetical protein OnM2_000037, partial [Erysiphe neolycopersici]
MHLPQSQILLYMASPLERQVSYTQYASNIASFISATDRKQVVNISPRPLGLLSKTLLLPLVPPSVHFTLIKPLPSDRLGPGATKIQSGKTTIYQAPMIPNDISSTICLLSTPFFNAGRDAVNPKGMLAYNFLNTVICTFLRVHSYSAFLDEDKSSITTFDQLVGGKLGG